jgi:hypothetical protein
MTTDAKTLHSDCVTVTDISNTCIYKIHRFQPAQLYYTLPVYHDRDVLTTI